MWRLTKASILLAVGTLLLSGGSGGGSNGSGSFGPAVALAASSAAAPNCTAFMPGCLSCTGAPAVGSPPPPASPALRRALMGTPDLGASATALESEFDGRPYSQPPGFRCGECDKAAGYALNERYGRCGEMGRAGRDGFLCRCLQNGGKESGLWL